MKLSLHRVGALVVLVACAGCGRKSGSETAGPLPKSDLPESFWMASAPGGAKAVKQARADARNGDDVVVTGRVKDFVDGRAAFTVIDASLKSCDQMGMDDKCETPWDFCCADATDVAKASAAVEFREGGRLLSTGVRGFHGIDHLKTIVVAGKAEKDADGNLKIVARGVTTR